MTTAQLAAQQNGAQQFSIERVRDTVVTNISKMIESRMITAPTNYKEEIFFAFQKMSELKDIDKCDIKNICNEMAKVFRNDLAITKNHCALVVINSKKSATGKALSMRWQYQGLTHVAKKMCGVKRVSPVLVFEHDAFKAVYDEGILKVEHTPNFHDAGRMIGGYCVVQSNITECRYYTREELDKRRGKSQKQQVWENGRSVGETESNFWLDWEREMYEKTLINATLKRIIETSGEADSDGINNDYSTIEVYQSEPTEQRFTEAEIIHQDEPEFTQSAFQGNGNGTKKVKL